MNDFIQMLKDLVGARVMLPVVLSALAGYLFMTARSYTPQGLFSDPWFLLTVVALVAASVAHYILTRRAGTDSQDTFGTFLARRKLLSLAALAVLAGSAVYF